MIDDERKKLNLKAGRLIQSRGIGIPLKENQFVVIRNERGFVGYAHYYLKGCYDEIELKNKADITMFKKLLEIDSKLGTTQSEQLFSCVLNTVRIDLIKV